MPTPPVELIDTGSQFDSGLPGAGLALCLWGGYRGMLFHLGAAWRLNECGYLPCIERLSSVSSGLILAGVLGLKWSRLGFDAGGVAADYLHAVVEPVRGLAGRMFDVGVILGGPLGPGSIAEREIEGYRRHLYGDVTLQDLPDRPRFVINAVNIGSGALWRFMKPYMRDYRVGEVRRPAAPLALAVAASTAFPPFLSPVRLELDPQDFTPNSGQDLQVEPFTGQAYLSDGGVYDNLGLETAWKRYATILVSDGGGKLQPEAKPKLDWPRHAFRTLSLIDNQGRSLRKRQLIDAYRLQEAMLQQGVDPQDETFRRATRQGAYWSIRSDIANYPAPGALHCPIEKTLELDAIPTRMKRLESLVQERLVNWGYAICDAALCAHVDPTLPPPVGFPYPQSGVG